MFTIMHDCLELSFALTVYTLIAKIEYSVLKSIRSGVKSTVSADILKSSTKFLIQEWNIVALHS